MHESLGNRAQIRRKSSRARHSHLSVSAPPADPTKDGTSCVCHLKVAQAHERWRGESKNCFLNESKLIAKDHFNFFWWKLCKLSLIAQKINLKVLVRSHKSHLLDPAFKQASCKYLASSGQESNLFLVNMRFYWKVHHKLLLCCINDQFHVLLRHFRVSQVAPFDRWFIFASCDNNIVSSSIHPLSCDIHHTPYASNGHACLRHRLNNAHFRFVSFVPLCLKIFVNALLK